LEFVWARLVAGPERWCGGREGPSEQHVEVRCFHAFAVFGECFSVVRVMENSFCYFNRVHLNCFSVDRWCDGVLTWSRAYPCIADAAGEEDVQDVISLFNLQDDWVIPADEAEVEGELVKAAAAAEAAANQAISTPLVLEFLQRHHQQHPNQKQHQARAHLKGMGMDDDEDGQCVYTGGERCGTTRQFCP
jgi:hypothetical protein